MRINQQHIKALPTGFMGQGLREVGFASAAFTAEQHILVLANEIAAGELQYLLAVEGWIGFEVEGIQRLVDFKIGAPQAQSELLLSATLDFVLQ